MSEAEINEKLAKWLNGELSKEDTLALSQHVDLLALEDLVDNTSKLEPDIDINLEDSWQVIKPGVKPNRKKGITIRRFLLPIAAGLALLIGAILFLDREAQVEIFAQENIEHVLPDASIIHLQTGSKLTYLGESFQEDRTLHLTGTAYLDVSEGNTFQVETKHGSVRVLGTSFQIADRDDSWRVVCYTGKVRVDYPTGNKELIAGQRITIHDEVAIADTDFLNQPVWVDKSFYLRATPLREVTKLLGEHYDVNILVDEELDAEFGGYLDGNNQAAALEVLAETLGLQIDQSGDQIRLYR